MPIPVMAPNARRRLESVEGPFVAFRAMTWRGEAKQPGDAIDVTGMSPGKVITLVRLQHIGPKEFLSIPARRGVDVGGARRAIAIARFQKLQVRAPVPVVSKAPVDRSDDAGVPAEASGVPSTEQPDVSSSGEPSVAAPSSPVVPETPAKEKRRRQRRGR